MPIISNLDLYKTVKGLKLVDEKELDELYSVAESRKIDFGQVIVEHDLITDENLGKLVADYLKLPFVVLSKVKIDETTIKLIPLSLARSKRVIAFEVTPSEVKLATTFPDQVEFIKMIAKKFNMPVKVYYATDRDIEVSLSLYKQKLKSKLEELLQEKSGDLKEAEVPVDMIVNNLIDYAYDQKASDVHIEPEDDVSLVRFRIDGVLSDIFKFPKSIHDQIISRIKVESRLRTDEHLSAQDGKMKVQLTEEEVDIRVSIVPVVGGEKVVLRLLTSHNRQFGLTDLGFNPNDLEKVRSAFLKPYGMVISTGPTGSGKTTTIYSILKILNKRTKNIATIEDPVEYEIEGINQIQVNAKTNLTFADGLRSILRQDPDIIYVGEIRDEETADIAVNSALTGHLVLTTLHTNDAATTLPRLIDMKIEPFLVSTTVNLIIAQRLIRKICEHCRYSITAEASSLENFFPEPYVNKYFGRGKNIRLYQGKGCAVCHKTGYLGRIGIFEVMEISEIIKKLIVEKSDSSIIRKEAISEGMATMQEDGLIKVSEGITTIEEVIRSTKE